MVQRPSFTTLVTIEVGQTVQACFNLGHTYGIEAVPGFTPPCIAGEPESITDLYKKNRGRCVGTHALLEYLERAGVTRIARPDQYAEGFEKRDTLSPLVAYLREQIVVNSLQPNLACRVHLHFITDGSEGAYPHVTGRSPDGGRR